LTGSLIINLGLLSFFKYGNFFLENFTALLHFLNITYSPPPLNIILPVGISFYTFQTLSYTFDIYKGTSKPWHSLLDYALYITFFPQLVAGPIVRASEFLEQCKTPKPFLGENLGWGLSLMTLGLFEKVVIADALLAPVAETLYTGSGIPSFSAAWGGTLAFSGQIFCDFAGYSTCAIGAAICLGFVLPRNFHFPYAAIGFSDFWRRWHISLSTWLRDYLYIPLGGNRISDRRTQLNLMTTMLLGGLWHGASWTFVAWGGLHGVYLISERSLKNRFGHLSLWEKAGVRWVISLLTFGLICLSWVFFRSQSFSQAWTILLAMVALSPQPATLILGQSSLALTLGVILCILTTHWCFREQTLETLLPKTPWWSVSVGLAFMLYAIATLHGQDRSFIYFQF
jgi:D-alanyl-lipoteichoic acid acyltransferase DltB (MBOAT superfamily)